MRKASWFVFILLCGLCAEQALARDITLPPMFDGMPIDMKAVKVFPSPNKEMMFISLRVQTDAGVDVHSFYDESQWRKNVDVSAFITNADPDPKKQYASVVCAMNSKEFELACSSKEELRVLDASKPWYVPVATVPASELEATIASLLRTSPAHVASATVSPPTVPATQSAMPPAPPSRQVTGAMSQPQPPAPYVIWDDGAKTQKKMIIWDD